MADESFHLVFRGEVLEGQHPAVVCKRIAALLKMDEAKAKALFSGKPIVLKRDTPKAVAAKYQAAFRKAGARLRVMPVGSADGAAPAAPAAAAPKMSLAERLAAEEAAAEAAAAPPAAVDPAATPGRPGAAAVPDDAPGANAFTLAEQDGDLLSADERPVVVPVTVDISHLSAAPPQSGSLEGLIRQPPPPPPPDTSGLSLDPPGVDLVEAEEIVVPELDLSALSLAEPGADLGPGDAGLPPPPAPDPDFGLAEPGADLGVADTRPPPPAPDTSHIELESEPARFSTRDS